MVAILQRISSIAEFKDWVLTHERFFMGFLTGTMQD